VRFSAGANWDRPAYLIEFLHELGIAPLKPLGTLLGIDGAFQQAGIMCREGHVSSFRVTKSSACAIGLAGCRFSGVLTLRLKLAQSVENTGMVRIDDVAADPGCSCEPGDRWRGGRVFGEDAKGFAQACIGVCPATGLRGG
jgi:hypothetical protein